MIDGEMTFNLIKIQTKFLSYYKRQTADNDSTRAAKRQLGQKKRRRSKSEKMTHGGKLSQSSHSLSLRFRSGDGFFFKVHNTGWRRRRWQIRQTNLGSLDEGMWYDVLLSTVGWCEIYEFSLRPQEEQYLFWHLLSICKRSVVMENVSLDIDTTLQ